MAKKSNKIEAQTEPVDKFKEFAKKLNDTIVSLRKVEKGVYVAGDHKTLTRMIAHRETIEIILSCLPQ